MQFWLEPEFAKTKNKNPSEKRNFSDYEFSMNDKLLDMEEGVWRTQSDV